jgi:hypothetical protein
MHPLASFDLEAVHENIIIDKILPMIDLGSLLLFILSSVCSPAPHSGQSSFSVY